MFCLIGLPGVLRWREVGPSQLLNITRNDVENFLLAILHDSFVS